MQQVLATMRVMSLLLCASFWASSSVAVTRTDVDAVRDVIAGLMQAWNTHDMHAFAEGFTDDAMFVNVNGSLLRGRAEIEESHKVVHASIFKTSRADIRPVAARFPVVDVALVQATWRITGDSRRPEPRDYMMTLVLRRQTGVWKVFAAQNGSAEDRSAIGFANLRPGDLAPIPAAPPAHVPVTDEDRVRSAILMFDGRWNDGDDSAIASMFGKNASYVDTRARWLEGAQQVANHIVSERHELGGPTMTSGVERVSILGDGLACVQLRWQLDQEAPSPHHVQGMGLRVLQREASGWQIITSQDTLIRAQSPS